MWSYLLGLKIPILGTIAAVVLAWLVSLGGGAWAKRSDDAQERYRRQKIINTFALLFVLIAGTLLWARRLQHTSTFLGLIGAGLAIALREPLLSVAGRIAIFAGHMYTVGDRIQIEQMSGDIIDVGVFYTRMMEIGNWVQGDQPSGRIVQFSNSNIFGKPVYNYTQNFSYIWDEIRLPVTYSSNLEFVERALLEAGSSYTQEFLEKAESDLQKMQHFFLVPSFDLKPAVYLKVTDNWVELTLRYIVNPKKRRTASTYLYGEVFKKIKDRKDVQIASTTMAVAVTKPDSGEQPSSTNSAPVIRKPPEAA